MISIVIPVYNEESTIKGILSALPYDGSIEVIVVDGGSQDRTQEFAKQFPVKVVQSIKNRAVQMNEGAQAAQGSTFLFLHADCVPERESLAAIENRIEDGYIGGCLSQRIDCQKIVYRFIEASGNIRARFFKIFYGDQGIFVRRDVFFEFGGFDKVDLLDDVILSKKLKNAGRTCVLSKKIFTSARRWERQGIVKTTVVNWLVSIGFILGVSPERLKRLYRDIR